MPGKAQSFWSCILERESALGNQECGEQYQRQSHGDKHATKSVYISLSLHSVSGGYNASRSDTPERFCCFLGQSCDSTLKTSIFPKFQAYLRSKNEHLRRPRPPAREPFISNKAFYRNLTEFGIRVHWQHFSCMGEFRETAWWVMLYLRVQINLFLYFPHNFNNLSDILHRSLHIMPISNHKFRDNRPPEQVILYWRERGEGHHIFYTLRSICIQFCTGHI